MGRDPAAAVRCTDRHDAPRFLSRVMLKQGADQYAAQTVSHEMHGIGIEGIEELREPNGIGSKIGANGSIRKDTDTETLLPQPACQHRQNTAREPESGDKYNERRIGGAYGVISGWRSDAANKHTVESPIKFNRFTFKGRCRHQHIPSASG